MSADQHQADAHAAAQAPKTSDCPKDCLCSGCRPDIYGFPANPADTAIRQPYVSPLAGSYGVRFAEMQLEMGVSAAAVAPPAAEPDQFPPSSIAATALRVLNASVELGDGLAQLARSIDVVVTERDALRSVLEDIVHEYDQTYDADGDSTGRWTGAASIPVAVMLRAQRLLATRS